MDKSGGIGVGADLLIDNICVHKERNASGSDGVGKIIGKINLDFVSGLFVNVWIEDGFGVKRDGTVLPGSVFAWLVVVAVADVAARVVAGFSAGKAIFKISHLANIKWFTQIADRVISHKIYGFHVEVVVVGGGGGNVG